MVVDFFNWLKKDVEGRESLDCSDCVLSQQADPKDSRDWLFGQTAVAPRVSSDSSFSLSGYVYEVKQQGSIGSCSSHAIASAYEIELRRTGVEPFFSGSELFLYWTSRDVTGMTGADKGIYLRDGLKALTSKGLCHEKFWVYNVNNVFVKPPVIPAFWSAELMAKGNKTSIKGYYRVLSVDEVKDAIREGHPVIGGFKIYADFKTKTYQDGLVRIPVDYSKYIGGHALLITGMNEEKKQFEVLNSWGRTFGIGGYCFMPYSYFEKALLDAWIIKI